MNIEKFIIGCYSISFCLFSYAGYKFYEAHKIYERHLEFLKNRRKRLD